MKISLPALCVAFASSYLFCAQEIKPENDPKKMVICCPVVSLRTAPKELKAGQAPAEQASRAMFGRFYEQFMQLPPANRDPLQDTQLLYNEPIICLQELPEDWLKVETLEQYVFNKKENKWEHVQGYIKKNQAIPVTNFTAPNIVVCRATAKVSCYYECSLTIPFGTKLQGIETLQNSYRVTLLDKRRGYVDDHDARPLVKLTEGSDKLRASIVDDAKELLGSPYCWGGRSFLCDCSGLINEAYRCNSLEIPRNSNPMYLKSVKVAHGSELKPADLIFFASLDNPEKITHVLMYMGNDQVIESRLSKGVAIASAKERFGKSLAQLNSGDKIEAGGTDYVIAFGSFLNDPALVRELNEYALGKYEIA